MSLTGSMDRAKAEQQRLARMARLSPQGALSEMLAAAEAEIALLRAETVRLRAEVEELRAARERLFATLPEEM